MHRDIAVIIVIIIMWIIVFKNAIFNERAVFQGRRGWYLASDIKVGGAALHLQLMIMAESSVIESLPRAAPSSPAGNTKPEGYSYTHLQRSSQEAAPPPPGAGAGATATTRMAYVVNSIKEGFRKLGAGRGLASDGHHARAGRRRSPFTNHGQITENLAPNGGKYARREGGNLWGVKRKVKGGEREVSFEMYLSSLPKADPVDRTVHWLFHHHDEEAGSRDHEGHRERNIASIRGDMIGRQMHTALRQSTHLKVTMITSALFHIICNYYFSGTLKLMW